MRRTTVLVSLVASVALAAGALSGGTATADPPDRPAAAAEPGPAGSWTKVSSGTVGILGEPSLLRTADGVLHVAYPTDESDDDLRHTAISPSGATLSQSTVISDWTSVESTPALVAGPGGGLRVLFGGLRNTTTGDPYTNGRMITATAPASGTIWTLQSVYAGTSTYAYASYGTAATTLADGTPVAAYPLNDDVYWHVGTGEDPDSTFSTSCCVYDLAMVRSGDQVWLAWYGNGSTPATNGTFVRQIEPALGPVLKAPGSSVGADSVATGRVALAARAGGGVYAAYCAGYPTCGDVKLWKVGAATATGVPGSAGARTIGLTAAPGGRLWVAWADAADSLRATRSNVAATGFGAVRAVGRPAGTAHVYSLAVEGGTAGRVDLVANTGTGLWHTQVVPGLSLKASPTTWRSGKAKKVRFTATDAGAAVAGVRVSVLGKQCTTSSAGTCRIAFPNKLKPGRRTAQATRAGYAPAAVVLKVTKPTKKKH